MRKLRFAAAGAAVVALCAATSALGGSGVGAVFNLGETNAVNARSTLTGTPAGATSMLDVRNGSALAGSYGVVGRLTSSNATSPSAGVRGIGTGAGLGVWGSQTKGTGVYGSTGSGYGVRGFTSNGTGVYGIHAGNTGTTPGVRGDTNSTDTDASAVYGLVTSASPGVRSAGVRGQNNATNGYGTGVYGVNAGPGDGLTGLSHGGYGVEGTGDIGVRGTSNSSSLSSMGVEGIGTTYGVYGEAFNGVGIYGFSTGHQGVEGVSSSSRGVDGESTNGPGVYGQSTNGYAGDFIGNVLISGNLLVGGGCTGCSGAQLRIAGKQATMFNGNVRTNRAGFATVRVPRGFDAKARSVRYQLTIVGTLGWNARVAKQIQNGRFTIQTDRPRVRVSWQVSAVN
jgi:hypothetical protein